MEMTVRQEERCLEIALIGELDHHAAREIGGRLDRAIEAALPLRLVLDWSGVTFTQPKTERQKHMKKYILQLL